MKNTITFAKVLLLGFFVIFLLTSCGNKTKNDGKKMKIKSDEKRITSVRVMKLTKKFYANEIVSNGALAATNRASLKFQFSNNINKIYVKNGDRVKKGQRIAMLEQFKYLNSYNEAKNDLELSLLKLQNVLIGQGYSLSDTVSVPKDLMSMLKIRSGYSNSLNSFKMAEYNYKNSVLYAPFSGVVGDITSKENNYTESDKPFCTIIDDSSFDVVFMILENELFGVNKNDVVKVCPYALADYNVEGKIKEINPIVDANGMVRVVAKVRNKNNKLFDGMNVSVKVECQPQKRLMIPKSALVLRSNRKVVFTLKNGLAQWRYIEIGEENSDSYMILKGLSVGDSVIYDGNMNLAHETPVKVVK